MLHVKAPGKLYIAGEYAVTEPGHKAVIIAVDRFISASIDETTHSKGILHSRGVHDAPVMFDRHGDRIVLSSKYQETQLQYITTAIEVVEQYVVNCGGTVRHFQLELDSHLADETGRKYGLGSSAAVIVAVVKALNAFYDMQLSRLELYKLAVMANIKLQQLSSCGDIAASVYSGWIAYSTFDHEWLVAQMEMHDVAEVMHMAWPELYIESLDVPHQLDVLIGWTGSPASSDYLVREVKRIKSDEKRYNAFLESSQTCVEALIDCFKEEDIEGIKSNIHRNRRVLQMLDAATRVDIETPQLKTLIDIANTYGAAAKTSGAGGGDCGIALVDDDTSRTHIYNEWQANGIKPLPFHIYQETALFTFE